MSEDLFPIADAKFREDVGRDDNEYSAYMAGFRAGVKYARRTPTPAVEKLLEMARHRDGWGRDFSKDQLDEALDALDAEWPEKGDQ